MRKLLWKRGFQSFLVLCLLFSFKEIKAQVGQNNFQYNANPKPLGTTWLDVSFFDNNNGLAVGNATTIARTTDGGSTWTFGVVMFTTATGLKQRPALQDVHYVTPNVAYATGDSGMLIKSTDGGRNWAQVNNPLYNNGRNINAVWFVNKDTGYIGGQAQNLNPISADSLNPLCSPKLYFTKNGGATWDSLNAPRGSLSWVGLIQNGINPPIKVPTNGLNKEIYRIQFVNDSIGYVIGSGSGTGSGFPQAYPGTTAGSTATSTFAANIGGLIWKFKSGTLIDYTITKEKLGYSGVANFGTPPTATSTYNSTTLPSQSFKAMVPLNDSILVVASFNNGCVVKVRTGVNDSTVLSQFNAGTLPGAIPGVTGALTGLPTARGKYEILQYNNAPSPPLAYNQMPLPVLPPYVIPNSNCVNAKKAPDGKMYFTTSGGRLFMSPDNGTTWSLIQTIPTSLNFSGLQMFALDITANGKIHEMGTNGVHTTSTNGVNWTPNYSTVTLNAGLNRMEFADCNTGAVLGNQGLILATTDGGKTWTDKTIASFGPAVSILGMSFPTPNALYFSATNGNVYSSPDVGTTVNLLLFPSRISNTYGMTTWGTGNTTRIWATAFRNSAPISEKVVVYRSLNNGATWDTIKQFSAMTPTTTVSNVAQVVKFVSADVGYMAGPKGFVYKTTNGGANWSLISPDIALTTNTGFGGQHSLGVYNNTLVYWALISTTRYMYKSTDGGATWSGNIFPITIANEPVTNIADFVMHDENNFIALTGPNKILITNNGGNTWRFDQAPSGAAFSAGQFLPKVVPAGTPMANRKMILSGNQILEYGVSNLVNVSSTETQIASCTNAANGTITITANGGIAPYTYSIDGGVFQSSNTFTGVAPGNHTIAVKDGSCVVAVTKTVAMGTRPAPAVSAGIDQTILEGDMTQLLGVISLGNAASIVWTPNSTLTNANTFSPYAKPTGTTVYTMTVTDANGCVSADNMQVTVLPYCLKVMDAFTPNGDGMNDRWIVTNNGGNCVEQVYATVFNRYGNVVYKNDNYQNNWDGTYNGKPVADATYYYVITYQLINGKKVVLKGDVTILR
jgi:gliding motility-associated-like protein